MEVGFLIKYILDDEDAYGYCIPGKTKIVVNLERIWWETKEWDSFVKLYSETVLHEYLHYIIDEIVHDWKFEAEEVVIRILTGEEDPDPLKRLFQVLQ